MLPSNRALKAAAALAAVTFAQSAPAQPPPSVSATVDFGADLMPRDEASRRTLLKNLAFDATLYGHSAYLQYEQMYRQAIDEKSSGYTGFNRFAHDRELAGPGYVAFKVPNSDTLYSNGWIDLTQGPVEVTIPPTALRYFTLNIFDIYGNPSNLGTRTIGSEGGRFLLVPPGWAGEAPKGLTLYRAATPHLWVLMRVFAQAPKEVAEARRFQDAVIITPRQDKAKEGNGTRPPAPAVGGVGLLRVLDYILRVNGHLLGEEALVHSFRPLGLGGTSPFSSDTLDSVALAGIESGYKDAMHLIESSKTQLGVATGTGWSRVDKGKYGFNYVRRAVINAAGLGANVPEENSSFTTFVDGDNAALNGATGDYLLVLRPPPPVDAFWSVTLYDRQTFELYPNSIRRYLVNDRTPGLKTRSDGSVEIRIQHRPTRQANWLPAPAGPFFVVIRSYLPKPEALDGRWLPQPIRKVAADRPATAAPVERK